MLDYKMTAARLTCVFLASWSQRLLVEKFQNSKFERLATKCISLSLNERKHQMSSQLVLSSSDFIVNGPCSSSYSLISLESLLLSVSFTQNVKFELSSMIANSVLLKKKKPKLLSCQKYFFGAWGIVRKFITLLNYQIKAIK